MATSRLSSKQLPCFLRSVCSVGVALNGSSIPCSCPCFFGMGATIFPIVFFVCFHVFSAVQQQPIAVFNSVLLHVLSYMVSIVQLILSNMVAVFNIIFRFFDFNFIFVLLLVNSIYAIKIFFIFLIISCTVFFYFVFALRLCKIKTCLTAILQTIFFTAVFVVLVKRLNCLTLRAKFAIITHVGLSFSLKGVGVESTVTPIQLINPL